MSFTNVLETVRKQVVELKTQSVNKIIALGHLGYRLDKQVAEIDGVDIVVGGHTDTFLYSGEGNLNIVFIRVQEKCLVSYVFNTDLNTVRSTIYKHFAGKFNIWTNSV